MKHGAVHRQDARNRAEIAATKMGKPYVFFRNAEGRWFYERYDETKEEHANAVRVEPAVQDRYGQMWRIGPGMVDLFESENIFDGVMFWDGDEWMVETEGITEDGKKYIRSDQVFEAGRFMELNMDEAYAVWYVVRECYAHIITIGGE